MKTKSTITSAVLSAAVIMSSLAAPFEGSAELLSAASDDVDLAVISAEKVSVGRVKIDMKYKATADSVTLSWKRASGASGYRVYRYDKKTRKYKKLADVGKKVLKWSDRGLSAVTEYRYKVKAYKEVGGKKYWGDSSEIKYVTTSPVAATIKGYAITGKGPKIRWGSVRGADGYMIYRCEDPCAEEKNWYKVADVGKDTTVAYPLYNEYYGYRGGSISGDVFKVYAYKKDRNGVRHNSKCAVTSLKYDIASIDNYFSYEIENLRPAKLKRRNKYVLYNTQAKKTTKKTCVISSGELKAIKEFEKNNFKSSWTAAEKAAYTLNWINKNVKYASDTKDWNKISGRGYADAVFNYKLGQCAQYNGAMVEMLCYLGYDASLIQGYRGDPKGRYWQHFWVEVKVGGKTYVTEAGNYGDDGNWMCLARQYSEMGGYIKNKKAAK